MLNEGICDFLFTAAPLNAPDGTVGPVNPVVLKAGDTKYSRVSDDFKSGK